MIFVDASAMVAIIAGEPEADVLSHQLMQSSDSLTSAIAVYETALAIARMKSPLSLARAEVDAFLRDTNIRIVEIGEAEQRIALDAFGLFGKGSGSPAKLNMGDCFAYACAKTNNAALLYKGDDFAHTDIKAAV